MRAVKRLHARNKKTACEYTHLQVWVWDACNLHKSFNYNSLNLCTETTGFTVIRKIVDEHELVNELCWFFYEWEMRVSGLRRLTCTSSAFLKGFSQLHELTWNLNMLIMEWRKLWNTSPITIIKASMKVLMCFLKFVARRVTKFFLMSVL